MASRTKQTVVLVILCLIAFSTFMSLMETGGTMRSTGREMSYLRSISGDSVSEHYYQLHGQIYMQAGTALQAFGALVLGGSLFCVCFLQLAWGKAANKPAIGVGYDKNSIGDIQV